MGKKKKKSSFVCFASYTFQKVSAENVYLSKLSENTPRQVFVLLSVHLSLPCVCLHPNMWKIQQNVSFNRMQTRL